MALNKTVVTLGLLVVIAIYAHFEHGVQGAALAREINIKNDHVQEAAVTEIPQETTLDPLDRLVNSRGRAWSAWAGAKASTRGRFNRKDEGPFVFQDSVQSK